MKAPPEFMGRARLVCYTPIDSRHRFTGKTRQIVAGQLMGPMAGLAICQHPGDTAYYLFGCDADWKNITDTWHQTLEEAKDQAEWEYEGSRATWIPVT